MAVDHMARTHRTYQWKDGRIQDVGSMYGLDAEEIPPRRPQKKKGPGIGIQDALLLFTFSSVLMIFAGGALLAFLLVVYSVIFG